MAIFSDFFRTNTNKTSPSRLLDDNKNSKDDKTDSHASQPLCHHLNHPRLTSSTPIIAMNSASQSKPFTSTNIQSDCNNCGDLEIHRPTTPTDCDDNLQADCKDCSSSGPHHPTTPDESSTSCTSNTLNPMDPDTTIFLSSQSITRTLAASPTRACLKRKMSSTPFDVDASPKRTISEFSSSLDGEGQLKAPGTFYSDEDTNPRVRLVRRTVSGVEIPGAKMRVVKRLEEDDDIEVVDAQQEDEEDDEFVDADDGAGMGEGDEDGASGGGDWEYASEGGDDVEDMAAGNRFVSDAMEQEGEVDEDHDVQDLFASSFGKRDTITISDDSDSDSSDPDSEQELPAVIPSVGPSAIPAPLRRQTTSLASSTLPEPTLPIDPIKHFSPHTTAHHKLHTRVLAHLPRLPLAPHRYWIAVLPPHLPLRSLTSEKQITWLRGNRLTTVETVWRMYALSTVSEGFVLVLGGGEKGWRGEEPRWETRMEEVDYFGDRRVVFRAVMEGDEGNAGVGVGGAVFRGLIKEVGRKGEGSGEAEVIVLED